MGIYINDDELRVMRTISPAARCAYIWLRTRMDWRTGLVGRVTSISRYALGEDLDYEVPKGRGTQLIRIADTTDAIKEAAGRLLDVLERVGLIVKRVCAVLTFFCPLASLQASVRSNQTNHKRTTPLSTEQTTPPGVDESSSGAGFDGFEGEYFGERTTPENEQNSPNAPHIIDQGNTSTPQSPSTDLTGVGDGAAGVAYRDRPTASQAGSLGRPGNTHETPNRDRPAGSHPAHAGRSGSGARRLGTMLDEGSSEAPGGLAESESALLGAHPASESTLLAVLSRRGIRVSRPAAGEPDVVSIWAAEKVTPLELEGAIDKALDERAKAGSVQPINTGYVGQIIRSQRSAARKAAAAAKKAATEGRKPSGEKEFEALARSLGMWPARLAETWPEFRARVYAAAGQVVSGDGAQA